MTTAVFKPRTPVITDMRLKGRSEQVVGSNGELNASSKRDLLQTVAALIEEAKVAGLQTEAQAQEQEIRTAYQSLVTASFQDKTAHMELGELMASDMYITGNREGFARRFLAKQELTQGNLPRVKMRMKNVTAVVASSPTQVQTQITSDNLIMPAEFDLIARPFVTKREIDQSASDVLDEKYVEATEALMVAEDRIWKSMADKTVGLDNPLTTIIGSLSPQALMSVRNYVTGFNIPVRYLLIANDLWGDIAADASWNGVVDQVSKYEILLTGQLGTVYGMSIISDAFRHPQHRVLNKGEFYCIGDAINHGVMTDRGGVESTPTDATTERVPGRGWVLIETLSMVIANSRSVAKGIR